MAPDSPDFAVLAARVRTEIDRRGLAEALTVVVCDGERPVLRLSWTGGDGHPEALDVPADSAWAETLRAMVRRYGRGRGRSAARGES